MHMPDHERFEEAGTGSIVAADPKTDQIELMIGDYTLLEVDVLVFYAQPNLELGSGFGTAISIRGGPTVKKELEGLGPVETCQVVITGAGKLKAKQIIHAVGPRFQEENTEEKLRETILNTLKSAEEAAARTIAFPPMGTGFYGIPLDLCARLLVQCVSGFLKTSSTLERAIICVQDSREYEPFRKELSKVKD